MKKCSYCGQEYPDDALVCATDQTPLDSRESMAPAPSSEPLATPSAANADAEVPDGFCSLGQFDVFEAERLLKRFEESGIRFLIDKVERRVFTSGGVTHGAGYADATSIEIFVRQDDEEQATKILRADWKV